MKYRNLVIILLIMMVLPLGAKGARESEPVPSHPPLDVGQTFVIGLPKSEDPLFLDPINATDATSLLILNGLFEGLFTPDPKTATPVPAIAKTYTVSEEGLRWTFILTDQARFSNGEAIDASTFLDSWLHLIDSSLTTGGNSYVISMLDCIEGVKEYREGVGSRSSIGIEVKNPTELKISLQAPAPYLPALLATAPFAAIHASQREDMGSIDPKTIISSGPYVINSIEKDLVILEKHPWYHAYQAVPSDHVEFRFLTQEQLISSYQAEELHWTLAYIPRELLLDPKDLHISGGYSTGFYYFSADSGPYANTRIRQALAMLIPWDVLRAESGQIFPTWRLIPDLGVQGISSFDSVQEEQALNILADEGYPYGAGLPTMHMAVHRGAQVIESARRIADIWSARLGITVILDVVPLSMYSRFPATSPYDFAFITWIGDMQDPFAFLHLWTSESGYNLGNYRDRMYDDLVTKAMGAMGALQRESLAQLAEQYLLRSSVVIPLYHGINLNIIDASRVSGWFDNSLDIHPLKHLGTTGQSD